jgi:hypothetical protein
VYRSFPAVIACVVDVPPVKRQLLVPGTEKPACSLGTIPRYWIPLNRNFQYTFSLKVYTVFSPGNLLDFLAMGT